ncbi:MAG TPA: phage major capsid protein, partial [Candidatus Dojkabacteria bacterium]|nr:phage major capsid protein [Candidatus Dojkabacteria bacterium]
NTANFMHTTLANDLKVANTQLILPKLGITRYTGLNGAFDVPNMAELTAYFVAEDAASTVVSITDNKATLTPRFIAANQVFSKQYLNQTSPQIQNQLIAQFMFSIEKGIEQEVSNALSGLTESNATLSAATWSNILALANYVPYNNAWVSSRTQMAALKATGKATYQGGFIWQDGEIDGVPAFASSLVPSTHIYTGDFSQIAVGEWDGGLLILTDPYTNKSKGKIDIQVSALRDAKVLNSAAFAKMVIG